LIGIGPDRLSTTFAMRKGDYPVQIVGKRLVGEALRDQLGGICGTVAGRDDGDVVPCAYSTIGTSVAEERRTSISSDGAGRPLGGNEFCGIKFFEAEIVHMYVLPWLYLLRSEADHMPIAIHRLSGGDAA